VSITALQQRQIRWRCSNSVANTSGSGNPAQDVGLEIVPMWILLLLPFIGLLWVPFYNFLEPALFGFPFFYWYQLVWVPISSVLIWLVYRSQTPDDAPQTPQGNS
jgi:hypothetical protein